MLKGLQVSAGHWHWQRACVYSYMACRVSEEICQEIEQLDAPAQRGKVFWATLAYVNGSAAWWAFFITVLSYVWAHFDSWLAQPATVQSSSPVSSLLAEAQFYWHWHSEFEWWSGLLCFSVLRRYILYASLGVVDQCAAATVVEEPFSQDPKASVRLWRLASPRMPIVLTTIRLKIQARWYGVTSKTTSRGHRGTAPDMLLSSECRYFGWLMLGPYVHLHSMAVLKLSSVPYVLQVSATTKQRLWHLSRAL